MSSLPPEPPEPPEPPKPPEPPALPQPAGPNSGAEPSAEPGSIPYPIFEPPPPADNAAAAQQDAQPPMPRDPQDSQHAGQIRRYNGKRVALSAVLLIVASIALGFLPGLITFVLLLDVAVLLVSPFVLIAMRKSEDPNPRSVVLGMFIGVGIAAIVGAGVCIAALSSLNSTSGG